MKPTIYVSSITGAIEKANIERDIKQTRTDLIENTIPPYEGASVFFGSAGFKSPEAIQFQKDFSNTVRVDIDGDFIKVTLALLQRSQKHLDVVEQLVKKNFAADVLPAGLTYLKVAILQQLDGISLLTRYANRLLSWVYSAELAKAGLTNSLHSTTRAEVDWLKDRKEDFFLLIGTLSGSDRDMEKQLSAVPDAVVNDDSYSVVVSTQGRNSIDPFKMGFLRNPFSVFFAIGQIYVEWQVQRYNEAKETKTVLELKLLQLKNLSEGRNDAKLEQQIDYTEGRLQKIKRKLAQMEEDYA